MRKNATIVTSRYLIFTYVIALTVKLRTAFSGKRTTREINSNRRTGMRVSPAINERMSSGKPGRRYIRKKTNAPLSRRSEERRVGKECKSRCQRYHEEQQ